MNVGAGWVGWLGRSGWAGGALGASILAISSLGSQASANGIVPPSDPAANCSPPSSLIADVDQIDYCRAQEGVGPARLPDNWSALTPQQQTLVIFDLERAARGLSPIVGLNSQIDSLSQSGADDNADPSFPSGGIIGGGGVWAAASTTLEADYDWMYYDGPGGNNEDCTPSDSDGCWGHRNNILIDSAGDQLVGGAGYAAQNWDGIFNSYAFEMDYDGGSPPNYPPDDFTWASELSSFPSAPGVEPLPVPTVASVSPSSGTTAGGTRLTITGSALSAVTQIDVGGVPASDVTCTSDESCTAVAPARTTGATSATTVTATNPAGTSSSGPGFTSGPPTGPSAPSSEGSRPSGGSGTGSTGGTDGSGGTGSPTGGGRPAGGAASSSSSSTTTSTVGSSTRTVDGVTRIRLTWGSAAVQLRFTQPRVTGDRVAVTVRVLAGSPLLFAVARHGVRQVKLRSAATGRTVVLTARLRPGRWTLTLVIRLRNNSARTESTLHVRIR